MNRASIRAGIAVIALIATVGGLLLPYLANPNTDLEFRKGVAAR